MNSNQELTHAAAILRAPQVAAVIREAVEPTIKAELSKIDARVFRAIGSGLLTPDLAFTAWHEKLAWHRVRQTLLNPKEPTNG